MLGLRPDVDRMTAAQVARLSALTGDWTEPLSWDYSGKLMRDDGSWNAPEGVLTGTPGWLTILRPTGHDSFVIERMLECGKFINRAECM